MSGGGFADSILGGATKLIRAAIQSPNYSIGVAGWSINKDGSAEFNNLTIRGTFMGTNFVLNSSGIFFYDPTETLGNLVVSITAKAVTGPLGESVPAGLTVGKASEVQLNLARDPTFVTGIFQFILNNVSFNNPLIDSAIVSGPPPFAAMLLQSGQSKTVGFRDKIQEQFNSSDGTASSANLLWRYITDAAAVLNVAQIDVSGMAIRVCSQLTATDPTTGTLATPAVSETWHDLRPLTGSFVGTIANRYPPQFRKCPDGDVEITGYVQLPAAYNGVTFANVPAAYRPGSNTGWKGSAWCETNPTTNLGDSNAQVDTSGNLQLHNLGTGLSGTIVGFYIRYPLNNTGTINS